MSEKKEIIEGNKLIAEFMGFKIKGDWVLLDTIYDGQYHTDNLDFNKSWKSLMPVVEKISDIKCIWDNAEPTIQDTYYPRTFGMKNSKTLKPMVRLNSCQIFEADTLIEATWLAVVDFLTWYNKTQQNEPR